MSLYIRPERSLELSVLGSLLLYNVRVPYSALEVIIDEQSLDRVRVVYLDFIAKAPIT
jgi:hypothetical protein